MPDIDTIIAKWKASFAVRARYEGQEPREDELLVAEVERLRGELVSALVSKMNSPAVELSGAWIEPRDTGTLNTCRRLVQLGHYEPHPTEPGMYRRKEGE